ncbi:hypothetical protein CMUS01_16704 [Colletotrichum musicola]|uniref:CCHC-type domain-containing protein n=1 Tax=Colletotrichum musicola TaxID=2175873 RepID=A0A8H6ILG5_9PEZI|nr:hypothetical protein CMUS01_16704 [Colletotrichum musicola]
MDLEPDSTSITVAREVVASDEDLGSRRVRKPSVKARLNQTYQEITEDAIERATEIAGGGRRTTTTRAATLAKERAKPIEDDDKGLLLTMAKQTKELHAAVKIMFDAWKKSETWNKNVEAELRVATAELQTVKSELQAVKVELQAMKERMEDESAKTNENLEAIATVAATRNSPSVSYADVTRSGLGGQCRDSRVAMPGNATLASRSDPLFCTIDTSRVEGGSDKPNAGRIRAAVEKEMRAMDGQGSWRCRAITVDPRNADRIRIICRDDAEHKLIKQIAEKSFGPGTRVLQDELYPVKIDNVKRTEVLDENGNVRAEAAEALSRENETNVAKISWLSKKDMPKAYGSMVVFVTKASDAHRLISEGFFHVGGESGTTMAFERRPRPQQCYNCQQITRHKAYQCENPQVCGRCAKVGHHHSECRETIVKCVPCGGPHESFSKNCPKLYPRSHE